MTQPTVRRGAGRDLPACHGGVWRAVLLGGVPRPADRRLPPARPRGQALLDRRTRRPGEPAGDPGRVRPTPTDGDSAVEKMITSDRVPGRLPATHSRRPPRA